MVRDYSGKSAACLISADPCCEIRTSPCNIAEAVGLLRAGRWPQHATPVVEPVGASLSNECVYTFQGLKAAPHEPATKSGKRIDDACRYLRCAVRPVESFHQEYILILAQPKRAKCARESRTHNYGVKTLCHPRGSGTALPTFCLRRFTVPVAQLDRASDYGSEGRGFESSRARIVNSVLPVPHHGDRRAFVIFALLTRLSGHAMLAPVRCWFRTAYADLLS